MSESYLMNMFQVASSMRERETQRSESQNRDRRRRERTNEAIEGIAEETGEQALSTFASLLSSY